MKMLLPSLAMLAIAIAGPAQGQPSASAHQPMKLVQTVPPAFPLTELTAGTTEGYARIVISVDETGRLADLLVTGYSERAFADAAIAAVKQWRFEPARRADGPVPARSELAFNFEAHGVVISHTPLSFIDAYMHRLARTPAYGVCGSADIDRLPSTANVVQPAYGKDLARRGIEGRVTVEYYIDENGTVRMPAIVNSDHNELSALAVEALLQWKFEPPTRHGRPVLVKVQQQFRFDPRS